MFLICFSSFLNVIVCTIYYGYLGTGGFLFLLQYLPSSVKTSGALRAQGLTQHPHVGHVQVSSRFAVCSGCTFAPQHPGAFRSAFNKVSGAPAHSTVPMIQTREGLLRRSFSAVVWVQTWVWNFIRNTNWWREFLLNWILWRFRWIFLGWRVPRSVLLSFFWWIILAHVTHWLESQRHHTHPRAFRLLLFCFQGVVDLANSAQTIKLHHGTQMLANLFVTFGVALQLLRKLLARMQDTDWSDTAVSTEL